MSGRLLDLDDAKRHIRRMQASVDGEPLYEEQGKVARDLARHLARRPGRDPAQAGEALIEAAGCLMGLAEELGLIDDVGVVTMLNVLGVAGLEIAESAERES